MGTLFVYAMQSALCLSLLFLPYWLLMRRDTFFAFNRLLLLSVLVLSFLLPLFVPVPQGGTMEAAGLMAVDGGGTVLWTDGDGAEACAVLLLVAAYAVGVLVLSLKGVLQLGRMLWFIPRGCLWVHRADVATVYCHARPVTSFSWMRRIVISEADYRADGAVVLAHELAHVRRGHSWDMLLAHACLVLQWFNPLVWWLMHELRTVHEYEADAAVLRSGKVDVRMYQKLLIMKAVGGAPFIWVDTFSYGYLKKRIRMMKRRSNPWARMKGFYVLPVAMLALSAMAAPAWEARCDEWRNVDFRGWTVPDRGAEEAGEAAALPLVGNREKVYDVSDVLPGFPGGEAAMFKFLQNNLHYPADALKKGVGGRVVCGFVVNSTGEIRDVEVLKSVDSSCDGEAVRVIKAMPKWTPGTVGGKPVSVRVKLPVLFRLR